MALFEIDPDQFDELKTEIRQLSDNLGKWQAQQTAAMQSGFAALTAAITGADVAEIQQRIDEYTQRINQSSDKVEDAIKHATGEGE